MEIVFYLEKENLSKVKNVLLSDEIVSRSSIVFKEALSLDFDKDGYFCYVSGTEDAVEKAKELTKDLVEISKNTEEIIRKIKDEESKAAEGFGNIFG